MSAVCLLCPYPNSRKYILIVIHIFIEVYVFSLLKLKCVEIINRIQRHRKKIRTHYGQRRKSCIFLNLRYFNHNEIELLSVQDLDTQKRIRIHYDQRGKKLQRFFMMFRYFKHNGSDLHNWGELQHAFYRVQVQVTFLFRLQRCTK